MTDEEKAKEWVRTNSGYSTKEFHGQKAIEAFLAGLKAGKDMAETDLATIAYMQGAERYKTKWHKVADGDLPKVGQKCYFIYSNFYGEDNKVIFSESSIKVLTGVYTFILDEETGEETTEPCFYDDINDDEIGLTEVYAWKEIILPKESE